MPDLTEDRRSQLDGIVKQMVANGEPDTNIQAVVDDFKAKYAAAAPEPKSIGGFIQNAVSSGVNFAKNTGEGLLSAAQLAAKIPQAYSDPREAAKMGGQLIEGIKHVPEMAKAAVQGAKDRYGSLDAIGNTLYTDPVGVAADVATLAGGVGGAAKLAGLPKVAKAAGAAEGLNPMRAATAGVDWVASKAPAIRKSGTSLYLRVLKPDRGQLEKLNPKVWGDSLPERANNIAEALIKKGVKVTTGGVAALGDSINELEGKRTALVKGLDGLDMKAGTGSTVTRVSTAPLDAAVEDAAKFGGRKLANRKTIASISKGKDQIRENNYLTKNKRAIKSPAEPVAPHVVDRVPVPDPVNAAIAAEQQLGAQARNIPDRLFGGSEAEVRAARQLGPMAAFTPRRLLGMTPEAPPTIIENALQNAPRPTTEVVGRTLLPKVRLKTMDDLARGTRADLRAAGNAYAGGRKVDSIARDKALLAGANEAIASAHPDLRPISQEIAREIDLEDFLERGTLRTNKHMLLDGFDILTAGNHPGLIAAKLAQRGGIGSQAALGVSRLGDIAEKTKITPLMERLALLAALEGRSPDEPAK